MSRRNAEPAIVVYILAVAADEINFMSIKYNKI